MNEKIPFEQRFGLTNEKPITNEFPSSAKLALYYILEDLINKQYIHTSDNFPWKPVFNELCRVGRIGEYGNFFETFQIEFTWLIDQMEWPRIFNFCERVYSRLLTESYSQNMTIELIRDYYAEEINQLFMEENIDYRLVDGQFERRGRAQTQKSIKKMGSVLADSNLIEVRKHYAKAIKFFNHTPEPDYNNSIKEALCALESAIEICTGKSASDNFTQAVKELEGMTDDKIPSPIGQSMVKIFAYRGSGQGISHSAPNGYRVSDLEAELVLNLTASFITYIVDLYPTTRDDLPF